MSRIFPRKTWTPLLALNSTLLLVLSLPPFKFPFIFFALVPFILLSRNATKKEMLWWSAFIGFIFFLFVLWPLTSLDSWWWKSSSSALWLYRSYIIYGATIALAIFGSVSTFVPFGQLLKDIRYFKFTDFVVLPIFWMGLDGVRIICVFGFAWGTFGYLLFTPHTLLLVLPYISVFGISGLIIVINMLIADIIDTKEKRKMVALVCIIFIWIAVGFLKEKHIEQSMGQREVTIALVAPNISSIETTTTTGASAYFPLIAEALRHNPDMIIFPENTFPFLSIDQTSKNLVSNSEDAQALYEDLLSISKQATTTFILGMRTENEGERFNSAIVIEHGTVGDIYNKQILIPFAEQSPEALSSTHVEPLSTKPGPSFIATKFGDIDVRICSEIQYSWPRIGEDTSFLVHISNDAIFKDPTAHDWAHIAATFRAIENETYVVRSIKGGESEIVGPDGLTQHIEKIKDGLFLGTIRVR